MSNTAHTPKRKQEANDNEHDALDAQQPPAKQAKLDQTTSSGSDSDSSSDAGSSADEAATVPHMSSSAHGAPEGDCLFCCEDLSNENYVEYAAVAEGPWMKSPYCQMCIEEMFIAKQWDKYLENLAKADCAAALRRVLSSPPQINVKDQGLPCENETGEVYAFWYASDNAVHSAKLKGSLVGAERDKFWAEKQAFLTATELQEELTKQEASTKQKEGEN